MELDNKFKYFEAGHVERKKLAQKIKKRLEQEDKVLFAYLHGSFVENERFRDLDMGIFLCNFSSKARMDYELKLEDILCRELGYPVDVRSLNQAPPSFCYSVIKKGYLIVEKDETSRVDFETAILRKYFDFLPFRKRYLQEALDT